MNRKRLAIIAGIVILVSALTLYFWPDSEGDAHAEDDTHIEGEAHADDEDSDTELPEGLVLIAEEQIRTAIDASRS